jgi:hypothetical protein
MTGEPVTRQQVARQLNRCARYDGRTLDAQTFEDWYDLLKAFPGGDVEDAVTAHYSTDRRWIMPLDIIEHCQALAAARAVEAVRQNPPPCWGEGCTVRYRLSDRPGSIYALPVGQHAETCSPMLNGVLTFDERQPAWSITTMDPATFDEAALEAGAAKIAAKMARYREIVAADPSYGPGEGQ